MDELKIKVADNGYVVEYDDPAVADANSKDGAKWKDPETYRVYSTQAALLQDLAELLPKLKANEPNPKDENTSSFNEAFKSE